MKILLLLLFLSFGCSNVEIDSSMGVTGQVASIDSSTVVIDNTITRAIENDDTSSLPTVFKETKNIRSQTEEIRRRVKKTLEAKAKLKKELESQKEMIWVELAYQLAPLLLGLASLVFGRLTNNPNDTKFGFVCFFLGFLMTAMYQTIGYWGIVGIGVVILGYLFYAHERNDLVKKQRSSIIDEPSI